MGKVFYCLELRPPLGLVCHPILTLGNWNVQEFLTDFSSMLICLCLSSLGSKKCLPNCLLHFSKTALHPHRRCRLVSRYFPQRGREGSCFIFWKVECTVRRPTKMLKSFRGYLAASSPTLSPASSCDIFAFVAVCRDPVTTNSTDSYWTQQVRLLCCNTNSVELITLTVCCCLAVVTSLSANSLNVVIYIFHDKGLHSRLALHACHVPQQPDPDWQYQHFFTVHFECC